MPCVLATCLYFAPMPCTVRAVPPKDRAAFWGGSRENRRYIGARRVLAQCMPPTEGVCSLPETGTQGTKGAKEGHTAKSPAPQRGIEGNRSGPGGKKEKTPAHCSQVPRLVLASCSQHACYGGKTTRAPPPPHPHPHGKGKKIVRGRNACPPRTKQQGGEAAGRGRGTTRPCPQSARTVLAPSGGNTRGGYTGYEGRRREPHGKPPPTERQVPRLVPASCSECACTRGQTTRAPPPPIPPTSQEGDEEGEETARGHRGGTQDGPRHRRERRAASGGDVRQPEPGPETYKQSA